MYNIFKNDFYNSKPAPKWAFTVEFFLSDELNESIKDAETDEYKDKAEWFRDLKDFLTSSKLGFKERWENILSKSVAKVPISHPTGQLVQYRLPGYGKHLPGRYDRANTITVTFNDNANRDVRFILESLMYIEGMNYSNEQKYQLPTFPKKLYFDIRVRVYDVERVNQYSPTEGYDRVSEMGTVQSFYYKRCFVSKLGTETNSYEASENVRTIEASITFREMLPE